MYLIIAYYALMNLENLAIFVDVMNKGSFTAVARDRNIAPSSISRAISSLEDELGTRLLNRTTRRIKPTEAGQAYFQRVEAIIDELEQAKSITEDLSKNPTGELRITASMTFGNISIVPLLPEFMKLYPQLNIFFDLSDSVVDLVDEGIDVAIRFGKLHDTGLIATRLTDLDFAIVASPKYLQQYGTPKQPADIQVHQCIRIPMKGFNSDWLFRDSKKKITSIKVNGRLQLTNALALKRSVMDHMGITMLSKWSVRQELQEGSLVQIFNEYDTAMVDFDSAVWLVYPSKKYLPLKVRVFIDFMKSKFQKET